MNERSELLHDICKIYRNFLLRLQFAEEYILYMNILCEYFSISVINKYPLDEIFIGQRYALML